MAKNTICLWYDKDAEAAAHFYAETFPDSTVGAVHRAPSHYPSGKKGDVLTVEFKVARRLLYRPQRRSRSLEHSEAFSVQIATDDQPRRAPRPLLECHRVATAARESASGWCKERSGAHRGKSRRVC